MTTPPSAPCPVCSPARCMCLKPGPAPKGKYMLSWTCPVCSNCEKNCTCALSAPPEPVHPGKTYDHADIPEREPDRQDFYRFECERWKEKYDTVVRELAHWRDEFGRIETELAACTAERDTLRLGFESNRQRADALEAVAKELTAEREGDAKALSEALWRERELEAANLILTEALKFYSTPETFEEHLRGIDGTHPGDSYIKGYEFDDYELKTIDGTLVKEFGKRAREALAKAALKGGGS